MQPSAGHLENPDLVRGAEAVLDGTQDAKGMTPVALEVEHSIHHVLDHLGAGNLTVLGDMTDEHEGGAGLLGKADQGLRGGTNLTDGAGCSVERIGPKGLNRVDDDEIRTLAIGQCGHDVGEVGFAGERHRRFGIAQARSPETDLRRCLLAREIDGAASALGQRCGKL